jgi:hypothetical protein
MNARRLQPLENPASSSAPTRGWIVGWEPNQGILIEVSGSKSPVLAQSLVELTELQLARAVSVRQPVLVTFEDGNLQKPVILGLLAAIPARAVAPPSAPENDEKLVLHSRESIELRCGDASLTLRKDGKVVLRGTNVISRSTGENRVTGASLHFN